MNSLNAVLTKSFDVLLQPFSFGNGSWGLYVVSFLSGIVLLKLFGMVSNQGKIKAAKNRIQARILQIVLYQDNLKLALNGALKALAHNFGYIKEAVLPLFILMVPCVLIIAQLYIRYDHRPFAVGEKTTLQIKLADDANLKLLSIDATKGIGTVGKPFFHHGKKEATWELKALSVGAHKLRVRYADTVYDQVIHIGGAEKKLGQGRFQSYLHSILDPALPMLDRGSEIREISWKYPEVRHRLLGINFHWLVIFLLVSIASGLLFKDMLGVQI